METQLISDNQGHKYFAEYEDAFEPWRIDIFDRKRDAGYINLIWEKADVMIGDLYVQQKFRRLGLGTQMFEFVKQLAIGHGKTRITGMIWPTEEEGVDLESLVAFYKKQGCLIEGKLFYFHLATE